MSERMRWGKLLSQIRVRELLGGATTNRAEGEARTEFERDYGRAVFSTPVRRLQDKAQVFPSDPTDVVRTRLTHSHEVSSVARDLARHTANWLFKNGHIAQADHVQAIEAVAATCGMIHDLGNPPFGHSGEGAIRDWFKKRAYSKDGEPTGFLDFSGSNFRQSQLEKDFLGFEGNAQTLRLVARLQVLTDMNGLNFTCGTLSAACKYLATSDGVADFQELKKPGYFVSENELISKIRIETGTGLARNPITYLVEASDDIVYSTVDIEDAVKKGVLLWEDVIEKMKQGDPELEIDKVDPDILNPILHNVEEYIKKGTIKTSYLNMGEIRSQVFRTFAISTLVKSVLEAFKANYLKIIEGTYHGELIKDCTAASLIKACQRIAKTKIYNHPEILRREAAGQRVIHDLMDMFWDGVSNYPKHKDAKTYEGKLFLLASPNYRVVFEHALEEGKLPERYCKLQLVTDYICGMTDTFACTLHKQLTKNLSQKARVGSNSNQRRNQSRAQASLT